MITLMFINTNEQKKRKTIYKKEKMALDSLFLFYLYVYMRYKNQ